MQKIYLKYFLAANSCQGFVSQFNNCYSPEMGFKAYIIKGGPGTGKSSFMKKVAGEAEKRGIPLLLLPCSSDPDSLDGVAFPTLKKVILDGTSPHVVEPKFPAVCETILNFGEFWDTSKFEDTKYVIELTKKNKSLHKIASNYLKSAEGLILNSLDIASACTNSKAAKTFASGLCKKLIPKAASKNSKQWICFLSGVTPKGVLSFPETVTSEFKNTVIIADDYGIAASLIADTVRDHCLENGYEIITIKNALLPNTLTDGILIPELSLAFIRECEGFHLDSSARRIHARRFLNQKFSPLQLNQLKFNKKTADRLISAAGNTLKEAKSVHDLLEGEYIKAMDFEALNAFTKEFADSFFN